jgi:hypothetical protein
VAPIMDSSDNTVLPTDITIRYSKTTNADVVGFPAGLTLIAGDGSATSTYNTNYAYFRCGTSNTRHGNIPGKLGRSRQSRCVFYIHLPC